MFFITFYNICLHLFIYNFPFISYITQGVVFVRCLRVLGRLIHRYLLLLCTFFRNICIERILYTPKFLLFYCKIPHVLSIRLFIQYKYGYLNLFGKKLSEIQIYFYFINFKLTVFSISQFTYAPNRKDKYYVE